MTDFGWSYPPGYSGTPDDERDFRCILCGQWASGDCSHIDHEINDYKPEYRALAELAAREQNEAEWRSYGGEQEEM